ncbi:hypothetical protein ITJ43_00725 [Microbacterium sp. VKM Ac-2870]|uniref:hypothetical protein n=1 Tax=Microbacterium sp. VKM Ac-2870 TaxID=2783825 RepID=UPI00188C6555|nr:hypothetical protein [Microbacterium sp. VKM Ac-2870]MBF4560663.1 hypothetical protein [Microbacterium sp. VKM Ac-2870]
MKAPRYSRVFVATLLLLSGCAAAAPTTTDGATPAASDSGAGPQEVDGQTVVWARWASD